MSINIEPSPVNLRGCRTGNGATPIPWQCSWSPPTRPRKVARPPTRLVVEGIDPILEGLAERAAYVPYTEEGAPLAMRVGRHVASVEALAWSHTMLSPDRGIVLGGFQLTANCWRTAWGLPQAKQVDERILMKKEDTAMRNRTIVAIALALAARCCWRA